MTPVIVVSKTMQQFLGCKFYRSRNSRYYRCPTAKPEQYLHRAVFVHHYGPIPEGFHVHHRDHDRANNQIENLLILPAKEHRIYHLSLTKAEGERHRRKGLEAAREAARAWHRCPEGLEWHRQHGERMRGIPRERTVACTCLFCGQPFLAIRAAKFCSRNCTTRHRYHSRTDHEERVCPGCGGTFEANRYAVTAYCSRACAARMNGMSRKGKAGPPQRRVYEKVCGDCGQPFLAANPRAAYCTHRCTLRAWKRRKRAERQAAV